MAVQSLILQPPEGVAECLTTSGKSVCPCLAALWIVSSVSCQFWQVGSDSSDGSVTQRIEVRYGADLLPERNDPPFAAESECGVQSINNGTLNIEGQRL